MRRLTITHIKKPSLEDTVTIEAMDMVKYVENHLARTPCDFTRTIRRYMLGTLWTIVTGEKLPASSPKLANILGLLDQLLVVLGNPLSLLVQEYYWTAYIRQKLGFGEALTVITQIAELARPLVDYNRKTYQPGQTRNIIDAFLSKRDEAKFGSPFHGQPGLNNLDYLIAEQFFAGTDTLTQTLQFSMMYMANNPTMQERVFQELSACSSITYSNRTHTSYTEAVLHEVHRKANVAVAALPHETNGDIQAGNDILWLQSLRHAV